MDKYPSHSTKQSLTIIPLQLGQVYSECVAHFLPEASTPVFVSWSDSNNNNNRTKRVRDVHEHCRDGNRRTIVLMFFILCVRVCLFVCLFETVGKWGLFWRSKQAMNCCCCLVDKTIAIDYSYGNMHECIFSLSIYIYIVFYSFESYYFVHPIPTKSMVLNLPDQGTAR